MQPLTTGAAPYSQSSTPVPGARNLLDQCRELNREIRQLEERVGSLETFQRGFVQGNGVTAKQIDSMGAEIMSSYRDLAARVKDIKSRREAGEPQNKPQVDLLDRRIKDAIKKYRVVESDFRAGVREQQRRQYLIVNPQATESEIREATEDGGDTQIFQQALLNSGRSGQAQSTLRNVQQRHEAIQKIERTMMELQQLVQDLDAIVVQQEPMIQNVEYKAEETHTHLVAGNEHIGKAVTSARAARKKKWICLGIVGTSSPVLVLYGRFRLIFISQLPLCLWSSSSSSFTLPRPTDSETSQTQKAWGIFSKTTSTRRVLDVRSFGEGSVSLTGSMEAAAYRSWL